MRASSPLSGGAAAPKLKSPAMPHGVQSESLSKRVRYQRSASTAGSAPRAAARRRPGWSCPRGAMPARCGQDSSAGGPANSHGDRRGASGCSRAEEEAQQHGARWRAGSTAKTSPTSGDAIVQTPHHIALRRAAGIGGDAERHGAPGASPKRQSSIAAERSDSSRSAGRRDQIESSAGSLQPHSRQCSQGRFTARRAVSKTRRAGSTRALPAGVPSRTARGAPADTASATPSRSVARRRSVAVRHGDTRRRARVGQTVDQVEALAAERRDRPDQHQRDRASDGRARLRSRRWRLRSAPGSLDETAAGAGIARRRVVRPHHTAAAGLRAGPWPGWPRIRREA